MTLRDYANGAPVWDGKCDRKTWYNDVYLKSTHWQNMRKKRIDYDGGVCKHCGSDQNLTVHHWTYENIGDERIEDLITLCTDCHERLHEVFAGITFGSHEANEAIQAAEEALYSPAFKAIDELYDKACEEAAKIAHTLINGHRANGIPSHMVGIALNQLRVRMTFSKGMQDNMRMMSAYERHKKNTCGVGWMFKKACQIEKKMAESEKQ